MTAGSTPPGRGSVRSARIQIRPWPKGLRTGKEGQSQIESLDPGDVATWPRRWVTAFRLFAKGNYVRADTDGVVLRALLRRAGNVKLWEELAVKAIQQVTGITLLNSSNVFQVLSFYEDEIVKTNEAAFMQRSSLNMMQGKHFLEMLQEGGLVLLPHELQEVLDEAAESIKSKSPDLRMNDSVDLKLFIRVLELLAEREGFCKSLHQRIIQACLDYDVNGSGMLETREWPPINIRFMFCSERGYFEGLLSETAEQLRRTAQQLAAVLPEGVTLHDEQALEGALDFMDVLRIARTFLSAEYARTHTMFQELDKDGDRLLSVVELIQLFRKLGVELSPQVLFEAATGTDLTHVYFSFDDFWKILEYLREREGLSKKQHEETVETFKHVDSTKQGQITTRQAQQALQWSGYLLGLSVYHQPYNWQELYGHRGFICEAEFLRLVREHAAADLKVIRIAYRQLAQEKGVGLLQAEKLQTALKVVNARYHSLYDSWVQQRHEPLNELLDFEDFRDIAEQFRLLVRDTFRSNCGFMLQDVKQMLARFKKFDPGPDGLLSSEQVSKLFMEMIPMLELDTCLRDCLKDALRQHHASSSSLDFVSFLGVLRSFNDGCMALEDEQAPKICKELLIERSELDDVLVAFHQLRCKGKAAVRSLDAGCLRKKLYQKGDLEHDQAVGLAVGLEELIGTKPVRSAEEFIAIIKKLRQIQVADLSDLAGERGNQANPFLH